MENFPAAHLLQSAQLLNFENFPACTIIPSAQLFERLEYYSNNLEKGQNCIFFSLPGISILQEARGHQSLLKKFLPQLLLPFV